MNYQSICKLQKEHGLTDMQNLINSGTAWKMEGSFGRTAMSLLESGACMLPKVVTYDYYGNKVPSRDMVKPGSTGSYKNSVNYWENVDEYDIID